MSRFFRRVLKVATVGLVVGITLGATIAVAHAETQNSGYNYFGPFSGYTYYNWSQVNTNNPGYEDVHAITYVSRSDWPSVPAGYMGATSRLYNAMGYLVASNGWTYNPSPSINWLNECLYSPAPDSDYYAHGKTQVWDTATGMYRTYWTQVTPYATKY